MGINDLFKCDPVSAARTYLPTKRSGGKAAERVERSQVVKWWCGFGEFVKLANEEEDGESG